MKELFICILFVLFCICQSAAQNNVGIGTNNPQSKLDVRGSGIGYDVFNASNDLAGPPDSILSLSSMGHLGIGTTNTGNYKLVALGRPSAFSPQIEVWNGNPNVPGSMMLGDIVDFGAPPNNGALNLYMMGMQNVAIKALGSSFLNGGNVGIGQMNPQEILHLNGALILGAHFQNPPNEVAGTIEWNGVNFLGFNGTNWVLLDAQPIVQPVTWILGPGPIGPGNPELYPAMPPATINNGIPGTPNPGSFLYLNNSAAPGLQNFPSLLMDDLTGGTDIYERFRISNYQGSGANLDFSEGIFNPDGTFKLTLGTALAPTAQGDALTMIRHHPTGIVDVPNQSRMRAAVTNIDWASWQIIPPAAWTPVNFTNPPNPPGPIPSPYPGGMPWWDEQLEFTPANAPNQPIVNNNPNSFFTATEEGFYQVNARCEFETDEYWQNGVNIVYVRAEAYVAIAIYYDFGSPAGWLPYAVGNHLQITNNVPVVPPPAEWPLAMQKMFNNNAPNVSDVVYLQPGDRIAIYVFQWAFTPMMLRVGDDKLYVSIHKIS